MTEFKEALDLDTASYDSIIVKDLIFEGFNGEFPTNLKKFSIFVNFDLFRSWIRQPSPCCAAASIVGAWNCILGINRDSDNCYKLDLNQVLNTYIELAEDYNNKIDIKISQSTAIDVASITSLRQSLCLHLQDYNDDDASSISSKTKKKKKLTQKTIKEATMQHISSTMSTDDAVYRAFDTLFNTDSSSSELAPLLEDETDDADIINNNIIIVPASKPFIAVWSNHINKCLSSSRLSSSSSPSTASIGNCQLIHAVTALSTSLLNDADKSVSASVMMGNAASLEIPVSIHDNEDQVQHQWNSLCNAISRPGTVLIGHITNHYTLLFATREFLAPNCVFSERQVLLARRGQKPTVWMSFAEFRSILLDWKGYKIISVKANK